MKNKDFREIQVSSSLLVVIFLGVLALGVFIFLLGVSVGKRQTSAATPTQIVTQQIPEPVKEPPVKPAASDALTGSQTESPAAGAPPTTTSTPAEVPAVKTSTKESVAGKTPAAPAKSSTETRKPPAAAPASSGLYYVQVGAYTERVQALAAAEKFRKQGYTAVVANPKPADTKTWYRVRLGGFPTRDKAASLLARLNAAAGKTTDYRVVQD